MSKTYPGGVRALQNVDFTLCEGEVHALLGENGAGKSTLAQTLYGLIYPDEGVIKLRGRPVSILSPRDALRSGILYIPQYPEFPHGVSLREVVKLYADARGRAVTTSDVEEVAGSFGWRLDFNADAGSLPLVDRQRFMLALGIALGVEVLILDEPTSFLSGVEVEKLLESIKKLKSLGVSMVYVTHRIREVYEVADRVTVLRRGRVVTTIDEPRSVPEDVLVSYVVGEKVEFRVERKRGASGSQALEVSDLVVRDEYGVLKVKGVDLSVARGEIVAIVGIEGMGQRELLEAIVGLRRRERGIVKVDGVVVENVAGFRKAGGRYVPGDRLEALAPDMNIVENVTVPIHAASTVVRWGIIDTKRAVNMALGIVKRFGVVARSVWDKVGSLSGGNQQKLLLGREMGIGDPVIVVMHNPTAGLDVASSAALLDKIAKLADRGVGVLFATPVVDEALAVADRILVFRDGRVAGEYSAEASRLEIVRAILA